MLSLQWSAFGKEETPGDTNDPLGLHAAERAIAAALVPGFSGATQRARSLALLLGGVVLVEGAPEKERLDWFKHFDRLCVHRVAVEGPHQATHFSAGGIRAALHQAAGRDGRALVDLTRQLGQASAGPTWVYQGLAQALGLLQPNRHPSALGVATDLGRALGRAALADLGLPLEEATRDLERGSIRPVVLKRINIDRACRKAERTLIVGALTNYRDAHGEQPFPRLAQSDRGWGRLTARQQVLRQLAEDLADVVQRLENPFRLRAGGSRGPGDGPRSLRDNRKLHTQLAQVRGLLSTVGVECSTHWIDGLLSVLDAGGHYDALDAHHRRLMASRGQPPWDAPRPLRGGVGAADDAVLDEGADSDGEQAADSNGAYTWEYCPSNLRLSALRRMVQDLGGLS